MMTGALAQRAGLAEQPGRAGMAACRADRPARGPAGRTRVWQLGGDARRIGASLSIPAVALALHATVSCWPSCMPRCFFDARRP